MTFLMIVSTFIFSIAISIYQAFCIKWTLGFFDIDFHVRQTMAFVMATEFVTSAIYILLVSRMDDVKKTDKTPLKAFKDSMSNRLSALFTFNIILFVSYISSNIINLFWS